jgi:hypothetical protein
VLREPGRALRVEHDRHTCGLFSRETWLRLLSKVGLEPISVEVEDPFAGEHEVFVTRRPA